MAPPDSPRLNASNRWGLLQARRQYAGGLDQASRARLGFDAARKKGSGLPERWSARRPHHGFLTRAPAAVGQGL